jgi:hypothetical protein
LARVDLVRVLQDVPIRFEDALPLVGVAVEALGDLREVVALRAGAAAGFDGGVAAGFGGGAVEELPLWTFEKSGFFGGSPMASSSSTIRG